VLRVAVGAVSLSLPLRAPAEDGAVLAAPPLGRAAELIAANRERGHDPAPTLLGRPWAEVRRLGRGELLEAARRYTADEPPGLSRRSGESIQRGQAPPLDDVPLLLAGHQPELFHPGVWVKNFALAGLARAHGGVAINLLVDNDTVKSTSLLLPARGDPWPEPRRVAFDHWRGEAPWEERRVADRATFDRFGDEASEVMRAWGVEPLLAAFWADARRQVEARGGLLGEGFAAARRDLERAWGCDNLEVPLSHVCRGEAFAHLAGALLADLARFVGVYNAAVHDHRRRHGIRSRHHPVPDLGADGDWLETPLWGWRADRPRRARLFARLLPDRVELRAGEEAWPSLPAPAANPARFVEGYRNLEHGGWKVRSRALVTTMFARLFLADLFVHGIGGAKYDELTDEIVRRFWGVEPPAFLALSATRLLPLPAYPATGDDRRAVARRIRDLHYNPQRYLPTGDLTAEKQAWIARAPATRAERRERFRRLRQLSDALRPGVAGAIAEARRRLAEIDQEAKANALLRRRDFSFCLYPEATLRPFCTRFL
jgi:hypothetical protein